MFFIDPLATIPVEVFGPGTFSFKLYGDFAGYWPVRARALESSRYLRPGFGLLTQVDQPRPAAWPTWLLLGSSVESATPFLDR